MTFGRQSMEIEEAESSQLPPLDLCPTCGDLKYQYGKSFVETWNLAMRWFPLYSLPELHSCLNCMLFQAGLRVEGKGEYLARRKLWLEAVTPVPTMDVTDPGTRRQLRKGAKAARQFKKLRAKQKEIKRKLRLRREKRKWDRIEKKRRNAIRDVLERAADDTASVDVDES
jgi:hypothetical protein